MANSYAPIELSEKQTAFIEWLCDVERVGSQNEWARTHDVTGQTLSNWKKTPAFKRALQRRLDELNVNPLRIQTVLDNLFQIASGKKIATSAAEQNQAAKTLLQYAERLEPARKPLEQRSVKDLSDAELAEAYEARAADARLRLVKSE